MTSKVRILPRSSYDYLTDPCSQKKIVISSNCDICTSKKIVTGSTGQKYQTNVKDPHCENEQNNLDNRCLVCNVSDCPVCCDPHESIFIHCDACNFASNIVGTFVGDSQPAFFCSCNPGSHWRSATETGTSIAEIQFEEGQAIDSIVIDEHNLCEIGAKINFKYNGENPITGIETHEEDTITVEPGCEHCGVRKSCKPIIVCFPKLKNVTSLSICIETDPDAELCIGTVVLGRKFIIELDEGWLNPFWGPRKKAKIEKNRCGLIAVSSEDIEKTFQFKIEDICPDFLNYELQPFIDIVENGQNFYFMWSIHQFPEHIAKITLHAESFDGSQYDSQDGSQTVSFSCNGYIC